MQPNMKTQAILPLSFTITDIDLTAVQMVINQQGITRWELAEKISESQNITIGKANAIIRALMYNNILTNRGQRLYTYNIISINGKLVSVGGVQ